MQICPFSLRTLVLCLALTFASGLGGQTIINDTQTQNTDLDLGNTGELIIGSGSGQSGSLTVVPSATVTTKVLQLGAGAADASGELIVNGTGAAVVFATDTISGDAEFRVGVSGSGNMEVLAGGSVTSGRTLVGVEAGSTGSLLVSGADSAHEVTVNLQVGEQGAGTATITNGATVNIGQFLHVGSLGDSVGTLLISNGGQLSTGTLTPTNGGISVGRQDSAVGNITVTGTGSQLYTSAWLILGRDGNGEASLTVADGGRVETGQTGNADTRYLRLGATAGNTGTMSVTGAGSEVKVWDYIHVGQFGEGSISVADQARLESRTAIHVGRQSGSTGSLTVSGGATVDAGSFVYAGNAGDGTIEVLSGGKLIAGNNLFVARESTSTGSLTVSGADSHVDAKVSFLVGSSPAGAATGTGTVTIASGGTVEVASNVLIRGQGSVDIQEGGTLRATGNIDPGTGASAGSLQLSGGRLGFGGTFSVNPASFTWTSGVIEASGSLANLETVPANSSIELMDGSITGSALALGSGSSITGHGLISAPVRLGTDGLIQASGGTLTISSAISGSGTIDGAFLSGSISPGNSTGTIALQSVSFDSGAQIVLQIDGADSFDQLLFDDLTSFVGSTLTVSFNDYSPTGNESFLLLSFTSGGTPVFDFDSVIVPEGWVLTNGVLAIPEPSTYAVLAGLTALGLVAMRRRRRT